MSYLEKMNTLFFPLPVMHGKHGTNVITGFVGFLGDGVMASECNLQHAQRITLALGAKVG